MGEPAIDPAPMTDAQRLDDIAAKVGQTIEETMPDMSPDQFMERCLALGRSAYSEARGSCSFINELVAITAYINLIGKAYEQIDPDMAEAFRARLATAILTGPRDAASTVSAMIIPPAEEG